RLRDLAVHPDRPRPGAERPRVASRVVLARAELVKIVVAGDGIVRGELLLLLRRLLGRAAVRYGGGRGGRDRADEATAVQVDAFGRDLGRRDVGRLADDHRGSWP